ncbi:MAG: DUF1653 domain-containing protein [Actinomycetota bacterium]
MVESHGVESHGVESHGVESHPEVLTGTYRHYKGSRYEVIGVATHSETEEPLVVYRALYGVFGLWVRPLEMFRGEVEVDGRRVLRFAAVEN